MNRLIQVIKSIYSDRKLIQRMAVNDFRAKYVNSMFGALWAYVQPLLTILVFWFVFQMGFKNPPIQGIPYITWFIPAYVPWIFFSDMLTGTTNCLQEYSYLVKKVKFKVSVLPVIKVLSALFVHIFFVAFIYLINILYGNEISIYSLQAFYYSFSLIVFSLGMGWLLSSLTVFFKDMAQVVNIILQIGFWASPILWNVEDMTPQILFILKLNPLYYIINGYRDSFINNIPFWDRPLNTIYYWIITIIILIAGLTVFRKTKAHFADEL